MKAIGLNLKGEDASDIDHDVLMRGVALSGDRTSKAHLMSEGTKERQTARARYEENESRARKNEWTRT